MYSFLETPCIVTIALNPSRFWSSAGCFRMNHDELELSQFSGFHVHDTVSCSDFMLYITVYCEQLMLTPTLFKSMTSQIEGLTCHGINLLPSEEPAPEVKSRPIKLSEPWLLCNRKPNFSVFWFSEKLPVRQKEERKAVFLSEMQLLLLFLLIKRPYCCGPRVQFLPRIDQTASGLIIPIEDAYRGALFFTE